MRKHSVDQYFIFKSVWITLLLLFVSCSPIKVIKYDKERILTNYGSDYQIMIDGELVDFTKYFLDPNNVESVVVLRNEHLLKIKRNLAVKYLDFSFPIKTPTDSLIISEIDRLKLAIVDGIPYNIDSLSQLKMEQSAIRIVTILKTPSPHVLDGPSESTLIISTKI